MAALRFLPALDADGSGGLGGWGASRDVKLRNSPIVGSDLEKFFLLALENFVYLLDVAFGEPI